MSWHSQQLYAVVLGTLLLASAGAMARQVTPAEAGWALESVLFGHSSVSVRAERNLAPGSVRLIPLADSETESTAAYVCSLDPSGYLVLSGDTSLPPVLAYSAVGDGSWAENPDSPMRQLILLDVRLRLQAAAEVDADLASVAENNAADWDALLHPLSATGSLLDPKADAEVVGPLIDATTWGQGEPWNDRCPIDPASGTRSAAGCVAVALAQVLNYWQYPSSVSFGTSASYVTSTCGIPVSGAAASVPGIDYHSGSYGNPDDATMAELVFAAGVSVRMDYAASGSGAVATDIAVVLAGSSSPFSTSVSSGLWGFETADIRTCVDAQWGSPYYLSSDAFYRELVTDLQGGRPVILCLRSAGGARGHTIICDGYDGVSGRYHLNMGWGGYSDGWYALPEDMPATYNVVEYAILHIMPPSRSSSLEPTMPATGSTPTTSFRSWPNPCSRDATIGYLPDDPVASIVVTIYDLAGDRIWESGAVEGASVHWNGRSTDGSVVAGGAYIYVAVAVTEAGDIRKGRGTLFVLP
jgi:hypothetical protein